MQKNMKAQTIVFEQVVLFSIGVFIFIVCFAAFNLYQSQFAMVSLNDQLGQVKSWVSSHILRMIENEDANSSIILEIPRKISGEEYEIILDSDGISIITFMTRTVKKSPLFNLGEKYKLSGRVSSVGRRFIIYKKGNEIIIS